MSVLPTEFMNHFMIFAWQSEIFLYAYRRGTSGNDSENAAESSKFLLALSKSGSVEGKPTNKLHTIGELRKKFFRYNTAPIEANPSYGSADLFMSGYFLELQKRLVNENEKYINDTETLNFLIKELSTPETPDAVIVKLSEMVGRTPEFLQNSYYFQEKGQAWIEKEVKLQADF